MNQASSATARFFSPLQLGSIADAVPPLSSDCTAAEVKEFFQANPKLKAVPLETAGTVVGVFPRDALEEALKDGTLRNYMAPVGETLEASAFIDAILEQFLKTGSGDAGSWYPVQHRDVYLGIISFHKILEYNNKLRTQDLLKAGEIQRNLLEKSIVKDDRLSVLLFNKMAHELGGDFYRVFKSGKDHYLVGCFDVAGKNISGSLATMALGACFTALELFKFEGGAEKTTQFINSLVRDVNPPGIFVTAVLFYIDFTTMTVKIHNCGFSPVLVFIPGEEKKIVYKAIQPSLPPLGIQEELDVDAGQIVRIAKDLRMTAYSDGLTDMVNVEGERYGEDRTFELLKRFHQIPQKNMTKALDTEILRWVDTAALADDVTLVDMRFN
jgi:sigma-B regulation protein RsbU (phosphoserine phosphatase)